MLCRLNCGEQKIISIFSSSVTTTKLLQMLSYNVSSPMIVNWQLPNPSLSSLNLMAALRLLWSVFSQLDLSWYGIEDFRKRTQIRSWWDLNLSGQLSLEENQEILKLEKQGTLWWTLLKTPSNCLLIIVEIEIWRRKNMFAIYLVCVSNVCLSWFSLCPKYRWS